MLLLFKIFTVLVYGHLIQDKYKINNKFIKISFTIVNIIKYRMLPKNVNIFRSLFT